MKQERLLAINSKVGDNSYSDQNVKSYDQVLSQCRAYIAENSGVFRDMEPLAKSAKIKELILGFNLRLNKRSLVEGFIDTESNTTDTIKLLGALTDSIQNYGILTVALEDNEVNEIRSNGRYIKVEKNGKCLDLIDNKGRVLKFSTPEEQEVVMRKMLGDVVFNPTKPIVNATTLEGYRLAATHTTICSPDPMVPYGTDRYHSFVLRKLDSKKRGLPEIVRSKTMSDNMARTAALFMRSRSSFYTCGPTASGKTTTNNAIIQECPIDARLVILQNVGEIDGRIRDEFGNVKNDVVHLLYKDIKNPGPEDPTQENVSDQILRFSPNFIVFGEWRADGEFQRGTHYGTSGHPHNATLHAYDTYGALERVADAAGLSMKKLCDCVQFIVIQRILPDGTRRVLELAEIDGVKEDDKTAPNINMLFEYRFTGEIKYKRDGTVDSMGGYHKRVGKLSDKMQKRFQDNAVSRKQYEFLLKDVDDKEVETYTGEEIHNYGLSEEDFVDTNNTMMELLGGEA